MIDANVIKPFLNPSTRPYDGMLLAAVEHAECIDVHAKGQWSDKIMDVVRPNEEDQYKEYRRAVFKSPTKKAFAKVENVIAKIGKTDDFQVSFKETEATIKKDEDLKTYTTKNFPVFDSVENWFFSFGLNRMLRDPNSIVACFPESLPASDTDYIKPILKIFPSLRTLSFKDNELAVLLDDKKSIVTVGDSEQAQGDILYFFDRNNFEKWEQYGKKEENTYQLTFNIEHNFNYLPAFRMGGIIEEFQENTAYYSSFISACLDSWDEAVRRYSDHQVNMIINLHPDRWEIVTDECKTCGGHGSISGIEDGQTYSYACGTCKGSGYLSYKSPFGVKVINATAKATFDSAAAVPTPPMGTVARDIASITTLKDEYKSQIAEGLSAINMEFLADVPLSQSGISKTVDRDELNSFLFTVERHSVENILKPAFYFITKWRYQNLDESTIDQMQPSIRMANTFDIISSAMAAEAASNAKTAGYSNAITSKLELSYAGKEFGEDSQDLKEIEAVLRLDPLPGKSEDDKMALSSSNVITKTDYILSSNLPQFIQEAIAEDSGFLDKPYLEKKKIVTQKAIALEVKISESTTSVFDQAGSGNKLAQTASALDSMIKITAAVKDGTLDYDAAVALVSNRFGIPEEQAMRELGPRPALQTTLPTTQPPILNGEAAA